jgi:4-carboxymuconolactone decarboxylase
MTDIKLDPAVLTRTFGDAAKLDPDHETREAGYQAMVGFTPPRVKARLAISGALDPTLLGLQESIRAHAFSTPCFDEKTTQLMVFGIMLGQLNDAAKIHAVAARRAGATWEELHAVIGLCFTFRGMPAANRGTEMLAEVAMQEARVTGP